MAKLSAREVESGVNLAVNDDAAAQTRAERDHDGILSSLSNARESLSLSSSVSVVFDIHLLAVEESGELSGDGVVSEGDVVGVFDDTSVAVSRTGSSDSGIGDIVEGKTAFGDELSAKSAHVFDDRIAASFGFSGGTAFFYDFVIFVYDTYSDISAAEVHADIVHSISSGNMYLS